MAVQLCTNYKKIGFYSSVWDPHFWAKVLICTRIILWKRALKGVLIVRLSGTVTRIIDLMELRFMPMFVLKPVDHFIFISKIQGKPFDFTEFLNLLYGFSNEDGN